MHGREQKGSRWQHHSSKSPMPRVARLHAADLPSRVPPALWPAPAPGAIVRAGPQEGCLGSSWAMAQVAMAGLRAGAIRRNKETHCRGPKASHRRKIQDHTSNRGFGSRGVRRDSHRWPCMGRSEHPYVHFESGGRSHHKAGIAAGDGSESSRSIVILPVAVKLRHGAVTVAP